MVRYNNNNKNGSHRQRESNVMIKTLILAGYEYFITKLGQAKVYLAGKNPAEAHYRLTMSYIKPEYYFSV
jgi:hypothetical protein